MTMSDREQKILEELEEDFYPTLSPPVAFRSSRPGVARRTVAACIALPAGVLLLTFGVIARTALGTALAVVAYVVIVGSIWTFAGAIAARRALAPERRPRVRAHVRRSFWDGPV